MNILDCIKVSYPYGRHAHPQIECTSGKYDGLIFELNSSSISAFSETQEINLNYDYTILKPWNDIQKSKFDGRSIKLEEDDQLYITDMVYTFIKQTYAKKSLNWGI